MAEPLADRNERPVCNCPTIGGEKVKHTYCPVHGTSAAMDALHALDAEAKAEPRVSTVLARAERASRSTLEEHYLAQVVCDHDRKMDNPVCSCSRVFLGWHPSVGAAVEAWVDHVMEVERAA